MSVERLIVFLKAPRAGFVKTRLAERIGSVQAAAAYSFIVQTLLENLSPLPAIELRYSPSDAIREIDSWLRPGWEALPQSSGELGERLTSAFASAFATTCERVVIIGSDCPSVTAGDIVSAWNALRTIDVVIGPANDGGYWLIGLRRPAPELFRGIPWSTDTVFPDTLARAREAGLSVKVLQTLADIDTENDWREFVNARISQPKVA